MAKKFAFLATAALVLVAGWMLLRLYAPSNPADLDYKARSEVPYTRMIWDGFSVPLLPRWKWSVTQRHDRAGRPTDQDLTLSCRDSPRAEVLFRMYPEQPQRELTAEERQKLAYAWLGKGEHLYVMKTIAGERIATVDPSVFRAGHRIETGHGLIFIGKKIVEFQSQGLSDTKEDRAILTELWLHSYFFGSVPQNSI